MQQFASTPLEELTKHVDKRFVEVEGKIDELATKRADEKMAPERESIDKAWEEYVEKVAQHDQRVADYKKLEQNLGKEVAHKTETSFASEREKLKKDRVQYEQDVADLEKLKQELQLGREGWSDELNSKEIKIAEQEKRLKQEQATFNEAGGPKLLRWLNELKTADDSKTKEITWLEDKPPSASLVERFEHVFI